MRDIARVDRGHGMEGQPDWLGLENPWDSGQKKFQLCDVGKTDLSSEKVLRTEMIDLEGIGQKELGVSADPTLPVSACHLHSETTGRPGKDCRCPPMICAS